MLALGLHDLERGLGAGGLGGADGGAEDRLFRARAEILDGFAGGGDEAAGGSEGLGETAADDVDFVVEAEVIDGAATLAAEDAEAVGVVEDGEAAVFFGDFGELWEAGDVAFHGVDALNDEHLGGIAAGGGGGDFAEVVGAVVRETLHRGAGELDAFPETGVDVLVGENDVTLLGEGGDAGETGEVAGGVDVAGFAAEEGGEFFLELEVEGAGTVGDAGAGGGGAPFEEGSAAGFDDLGVEREPEVIVAGEHDHLAAIQVHGGALLRVHGVVVGVVFQPHLRRVVIAEAVLNGLFVFAKEGERHVWAKRCAAGRGWQTQRRVGQSRFYGRPGGGLRGPPRQGRQPGGDVARVVGPRAKTAGAGGGGEGGEFRGHREQAGECAGERRGVDAVEHEATAIAGGFAKGAMGGADAGFAAGEAFEDGEAEALD